jgi:GNAT superfamily N-acetyltransferase
MDDIFRIKAKMNKRIVKNTITNKDFGDLIARLYLGHPEIIDTKINEFQAAFSLENPFFKYAKVHQIGIFEDSCLIGCLAATVDSRYPECGFLGFFECVEDLKCAEQLLGEAGNFFKQMAVKECRGPINFTVWQNFRASYPEDNEPYLLEPFTRGYYRNLFLDNGFRVDHENITTISPIAGSPMKNYEIFYDEAIKDGYRFELLNKDNFGVMIGHIYVLMKKVFKGSYSFYDISKEEFVYITNFYSSFLKKHYVFLIKEPAGKPVGFFFALPDYYHPENVNVVLKTMGLLPAYRGKGLAQAMFYYIYRDALVSRFKNFIFSTTSVGNDKIDRIVKNSDNKVYRRYETFMKVVK